MSGVSGSSRLVVGVMSCLMAFGAIACEPVASAPATLNGGVYCLVGDVSVEGEPAFTLEDDSTLDCRGHTIKDTSRSTVNAVVASGDNIHVTGCVFDGFLTPLRMSEATHFRITGNKFLSPMNTAIFVSGDEGLIADNAIIWPAARIPGYQSTWYSDASGIWALGTVDILRNTIVGANPGEGAQWRSRFGIYSSGANRGGLIASNVIVGLVPGALDRRIALFAGNAVVYRNLIASIPTSLAGSDDIGIYCGGYYPTDIPSLLSGNIVRGYTWPVHNCPDSVLHGQGLAGHQAGLHLHGILL
ncbi:MAG: hypothetical protein ACTHOC_05150 [Luteimonas sp.]